MSPLPVAEDSILFETPGTKPLETVKAPRLFENYDSLDAKTRIEFVNYVIDISIFSTIILLQRCLK